MFVCFMSFVQGVMHFLLDHGFFFLEKFAFSKFCVIFEFVFLLNALLISPISYKWIRLFSSKIHSRVTRTYLFIYLFEHKIISTQIKLFSMNIILCGVAKTKFYRSLYCNLYFA